MSDRLSSKQECMLSELAVVSRSVEPEMFMWEQTEKPWQEIGGFRGTLAVLRQAMLMRNLIKTLTLHPADSCETEWLSIRCHWILVLVIAQAITLPFSKHHIATQLASQLLSDIRVRTMTISAEYSRALYDRLYKIA